MEGSHKVNAYVSGRPLLLGQFEKIFGCALGWSQNGSESHVPCGEVIEVSKCLPESHR
jgi:hypothetical protein